ncbi:TP901 family phage tail tape measure protein [Tepidimonas ignava]|uniref:Phage tail tape measure protein n=1 Tax=Tepidimonas ignava TaxID=114249 RepID=A0A4R3LMN8_9BURK|nr:phage tail tape measure protein [Tepidimonas ignava]TCS99106.1 TP901 family phage tail tape measure protein [Tepidimonas ignava]TSE22810.1 phage tail tape measure protein [Tepidimonas ignava]
MAASHPVTITIGAALATSLGSAVRSAQDQLNRLGSTMAELGNRQAGIKQLESLRQQAIEAGKAWQEAQDKIRQLQQAKASGQWSTPALDKARARVAAAEARAADPALSEKARARAEAALAKARESLAAQQAKADARYQAQLDALIAKASKAKSALDAVKASLAQQTAELQKSGVATAKLGAESERLGSQLEKLRERTEALTRAQQARASNLERRSAYRAQMMDAVALGGALYGLVKPAVQFESVMADVKKVVNFDTPQQFAQMSKDILELSTRIPMAADGIGAIVAAAGQAGIARHELVRFAEDAAKMGVAFDLSGEQAGAAMTGLRTIFGLTQDEVVKLGDAINHLSNNMDAKAADLLNIANRAGSTAKLFGLSGAQLNALGATFLALKTPPEVAATGINALLLKLATADKQSDKFQQALAQLGLSAKELKKDIALDAQGTLINFLEAVKGAPDVMGTLSDLFGAEYSDDIAKLVGSLDTYRQAIGLVADETAYAGSMQREYEARAATTANNLQLLKNQISRLGITIGNALLPPLNSLLGALMAPIGALAQLAERFPVITQVVVGTIGAVVGLKVATIALGYAWTFVKGPILGAQVAVQSARAELARLQAQAAATGASAGILSLAWARIKMGALGLIAPIKSAALAFWSMLPAIGATTTALLANPITWIVAGIGAAVAGLALVIRKYWDPIAAYLGGVWEGIRATVQPAVSSITQALAPLAPIGRAVGAAFGWIGDAASGLIRLVGQLLAPVTLTQDEFNGLSESGRSLGAVIGSVLRVALLAVTAPLRAIGALVTWVRDGFTALSGIWRSVASIFASPDPLLALQASLGSMLSHLRQMVVQFADVGRALLQGLARGISEAAQQAVAAVGEVAAKVRDRFKAMLGIHSPSRVFATLGSALSLGLAQGVAAAGPQAVDEVGRLAKSLQAVPFALTAPGASSTDLRPPLPDRPPMGLSVPTDRIAGSPSATPSIHFAPQITIYAPPGSDAQSMASDVEQRLRRLIHDALRGSRAALHD